MKQTFFVSIVCLAITSFPGTTDADISVDVGSFGANDMLAVNPNIISDNFDGTTGLLPTGWNEFSSVNDPNGVSFEDLSGSIVRLTDTAPGNGPAAMYHDTKLNPTDGFEMQIKIDHIDNVEGEAFFGVASLAGNGSPRLIVNVDATRVSIGAASSTGDDMFTLDMGAGFVPDLTQNFSLIVEDTVNNGAFFRVDNGTFNGTEFFSDVFTNSQLTLGDLGTSIEVVVGASDSTSVPEPIGVSLLALAVLGFAVRQRRQR